MLRSLALVAAASVLCACGASAQADRSARGLQITEFIDSAGLHQALLSAPAAPADFTHRPLLWVKYDSAGGAPKVTALFATVSHAAYGRVLEEALRAHVRTQPPSRKPASEFLLLRSGPTPLIHAVKEPSERAPVVRNQRAVARELSRVAAQFVAQQPLLAGDSRTAVLSMRVGANGVPATATIHRPSGRSDVDQELVRVARSMRFTPAQIEDFPVPVTVQIPVSIQFPAARRQP